MADFKINPTVNGAVIWHADNDGASSGMDADTLDGEQGISYHNASNLNAGTVPSARLTGTPGAYGIDPVGFGSPGYRYVSLTNATATGLAAIKSMVHDMTAHKLPSTIEYTRNGTDWIAFTTNERNAVKPVFTVDNSNGALLIKNGGAGGDPLGAWQSFRMTWDAVEWTKYSYLRYLYFYFITNQHSLTSIIEASFNGTTWVNFGNHASFFGSPAHFFASHAALPWRYNPTEGSHYRYVRIVLTPAWNASYPNNNIQLYHLKWMALYHAAETTDRLLLGDFDRNITFFNTATGPRLRLTAIDDVDLASVNHALQIGPDNGTNLALDNNEIQARNNGAASGLYLNQSGGDVFINAQLAWHAGNDGPGSGLDADTLDGQHLADINTAVQIHAAPEKTTPVDADEIPLADSAASWVLKKLTWANLKATAKAYFDTLYLALSNVGNASGNVPISNGTTCTNLRAAYADGATNASYAESADKVDSYHASPLNVASYAAVRDASGDVVARLFRPEYSSAAGTSFNYLNVQNAVGSGVDNYMRAATFLEFAQRVGSLMKIGTYSIGSNSWITITGLNLNNYEALIMVGMALAPDGGAGGSDGLGLRFNYDNSNVYQDIHFTSNQSAMYYGGAGWASYARIAAIPVNASFGAHCGFVAVMPRCKAGMFREVFGMSMSMGTPYFQLRGAHWSNWVDNITVLQLFGDSSTGNNLQTGSYVSLYGLGSI